MVVTWLPSVIAVVADMANFAFASVRIRTARRTPLAAATACCISSSSTSAQGSGEALLLEYIQSSVFTSVHAERSIWPSTTTLCVPLMGSRTAPAVMKYSTSSSARIADFDSVYEQ